MPNSYRLPVSFKNRVVEAMGHFGLDDPSAFEWTDYKAGNSGFGEQIVHTPTGSHFNYHQSLASTSLWCEWAPATGDGTHRQGHASGDVELTAQIIDWLRVVKREYEVPNLWEALKSEGALIVGEIVDGDEHFTTDEQRLIGERIDQLEAQINALAPQATDGQRRHVKLSLKHVKEAAKRVSRIDWKSIFVGKLIDIVFTLALDPQKAHQLFHFATLYLGPFVTRITGLLGGG